MQARLKTSKKWTKLPNEYVEKIQEVFSGTFNDQLEAGDDFSIEGRIYTEEVLMRVGIKHKGKLAHANFETSVQYNPQNAGEGVEMIYLSIDAIASMIEQYLESLVNETRIDFPRNWTEFQFSGKAIYLQFSTTNTDLEAQADALLGLAAEGLIVEESADDALDRAEVDSRLNVEDEDAPWDDDAGTLSGEAETEDEGDDLNDEGDDLNDEGDDLNDEGENLTEDDVDTTRPSIFSNKTRH